MIVYKKTPHLRLTRAQVPEAPYWAATTIAPYSPRRAAPIAIDYVDLRASCAERVEAPRSQVARMRMAPWPVL